MKGRYDYYAKGDWNATCYACGKKFKASMLRKTWQGYYACDECWEPRHPQDFVRGVADSQTPPWTQPRPADVFVEICTPNGSTAYPGAAIPNCVVPSYVSPFYDPDVE